MPLEQMLLAVLGILVLASLLIVASIQLQVRRRRRIWPGEPITVGPSQLKETPVEQQSSRGPGEPGQPSEPSASPAVSLVRRRPRTADETARAAATIEALVSRIAADAAGLIKTPRPTAVIATSREAPPASARRPDVDAPGSHLEGLADPAFWAESIRDESVRIARFGHPVTVVLAELPRLDAVAELLGRDVADRITRETARVLVTEGRAADRIARLGDARFGVLLIETSEVGARAYIDRIRTAIDGWLESAGLSMRLSLGWACPADGDDVMAAAAVAQLRMQNADRGMSGGATVVGQA